MSAYNPNYQQHSFVAAGSYSVSPNQHQSTGGNQLDYNSAAAFYSQYAAINKVAMFHHHHQQSSQQASGYSPSSYTSHQLADSCPASNPNERLNQLDFDQTGQLQQQHSQHSLWDSTAYNLQVQSMHQHQLQQQITNEQPASTAEQHGPHHLTPPAAELADYNSGVILFQDKDIKFQPQEAASTTAQATTSATSAGASMLSSSTSPSSSTQLGAMEASPASAMRATAIRSTFQNQKGLVKRPAPGRRVRATNTTRGNAGNAKRNNRLLAASQPATLEFNRNNSQAYHAQQAPMDSTANPAGSLMLASLSASSSSSRSGSSGSASANLINESATYKDADIEHTSKHIKVTNVQNGREVILTNDELTHYSVRKLNQIVSDFPRQTIKKLKQRRRTLKNRGYAQNCRHKRLDAKNRLEQENQSLAQELKRVRAELRKAQLALMALEATGSGRYPTDELNRASVSLLSESCAGHHSSHLPTGSPQYQAPDQQQVSGGCNQELVSG